MKRMFAITFILFTIIFISQADAGKLYARRPGTETPVYNLAITHIRTSIKIYNQLAVTHVDEEFYNDNNLTLEGFYAFQLPEGSKVDGLWLWVDGKRLIFIVKKKEDAERQYDSVVIGTRRDPAILESLGANRFQLKVWPINAKSSRRIEMQYFNTLPIGQDGLVQYSYPLNNLNYQNVPVNNTEMVIDVNGEQVITEFKTNFDDRPMMNRVTKVDNRHYTISFGTENANYTEDYNISFRLEALKEIFPVLTYQTPNAPSEDPYFMMWFPIESADTLASLTRDYAFVLDASGSMAGSRIDGVKTAYEKILRSLKPSDRFRIVLFSSAAISFPSDTSMLFGSSDNITQAINYISKNYSANGATNYEDAFRLALTASYRNEADKRMIFLTDGEPNIGAIDYTSLLAAVKLYDKSNVRLFPVLLYASNIKVLYDLSAERWGKTTSIELNDDIQVVISRLMVDLNISGYQDVSVQFANKLPYDVYPRTYSAVTAGDQLIASGRFSTDGNEIVTVSFRDADGKIKSKTQNVSLLRSHSSLIQVSRYWAAQKIDALLDDIRTYGESTELKNSIIALSMQYMILTQYTAFLVLETNPIDPTDVAGEATVVKSFDLFQNYPNPFGRATFNGNPATTIAFELPKQEHVTLIIYDLLGRIVRILVDNSMQTGRHTIMWDGKDESGRLMHSGMYLCVMKAGNFQKTIRMTLLK